jgi:hypothetical protein
MWLTYSIGSSGTLGADGGDAFDLFFLGGIVLSWTIVSSLSLQMKGPSKGLVGRCTENNDHHTIPILYNKLLQYRSPKGILLLANHTWSIYHTRRFHLYGHSYLAPTPSITTTAATVQSLGVSLIKAFTHHVHENSYTHP